MDYFFRDLENAIMAHPGVAEAAVIGVAHTKDPLGGVVLKPGATVTTEELKGFLKDRVRAAGWIPGEVVLLDQILKTSVGKFNKKELRKMVADGRIKIPCQP